MRRCGPLSIILILCLSCTSFAQEYSYTHYDITDGLAGSVVYCITQDRDGFIWMGTETGVSRFDGTHFKTFTVTDGLPDIEILAMFGDSKGRVWMGPFRKSVCYYYQGQIHNQDNDSLLGSIHLRENVEAFAEDDAGNILILEPTRLHWFGADGVIREIDSLGGLPIRNAVAISRSASGHFLVQTKGRIFNFPDAGSDPLYVFSIRDALPTYMWMGPSGMIWREDTITTMIHSFVSGKTVTLPFPYFFYRQINFAGFGDSLYYFNETMGCREYNLYTGASRLYLPDKAVSKIFRDATGNVWFTTLGQGLFRLNSDEFKTIRIKAPGLAESSVHAIRRIGDELVVGDNHNVMYTISLPGMRVTPHVLRGEARNRILFIGRVPNGSIYWGTDQWLSAFGPGYRANSGNLAAGIKDIAVKNDSELIVGTHAYVLRVRMPALSIIDTLWRERSTAVFCRGDTVYIGTLNGLYRLDPDRSATFLGKTIPFLKKRISKIVMSGDGALWIASYDAGVLGYRGGKVIATLTTKQGLTSNICKTLYIQDSSLWIGTDKGLNKVQLDRPGYPITRFTSKDGLGSDIVNSVYADGPMIYVGTTAGLSYFDQRKVNVTEECRLHLLSILNGGKERLADSAHLSIPFRDKNIRFEFAAISYRSVGDIRYRYRILGLDTTWRETKETFLEYPALPSGEYTFQLQGINKFGIRSDVLSLGFEVAVPFWQALWFDALGLGVFLALVWLFVTQRIRIIRNRQAEKERLSHRLMELESTALQSQMNPHFIFNCLNSIQQFIFDHEALVANKYLTGFARLIRATLHNSSRTFIPLVDEIDYLSTYLSLEKLRFKEKMEYAIEVDPAIETDSFLIPPMLIQPFVENSMRHGLRHKMVGKGMIRLTFKLSGENLRVIVEDNGIGRKKAASYRTKEHIEYQSKGMSLTADRIRTINAKYDKRIQIEVVDLEDDKREACGTRVILQFPVFYSATQKELI